MLQKKKTIKRNSNIFHFGLLILTLFLCFSCSHKKPYESYHPFEKGNWPRFDIVKFEIPVSKTDGSYDIVLFARLTPQFSYESLNFNMIMNTPSGEERIRDYEMKVRSKTGDLVIDCKQGICEGSVVLKEGLTISKPGKLIIELENLIPRLEAEGISGIGIRVIESGK
ncbi:MAG: gliding motility lipoprotein GldH [Bacteroidales bacterium]|nr:gliding motility lipoprotein GldH [Bacteroidales bacterium]